jgi:intracellular sulfur oxidation DsrE/DsrF family protein
MHDEAYEGRFGVQNPNTELISALADVGVIITVCGQSMISREVPAASLNERVQVATSMLTTVTTYHQKGYTLLRF